MKITQVAIGDKVSEADQKIIDGMAHLVYESFKIILSDLLKDGLAEKGKPPQPQAAVVGAYLGLMRIYSLDGLIDPKKAFDELNKELSNLVNTARIGECGKDNIQSILAEVEAAIAKEKCKIN